MQQFKDKHEAKERRRNRFILFGIIVSVSLLAGLLTSWLASP